jgi:hypothetical protein
VLDERRAAHPARVALCATPGRSRAPRPADGRSLPRCPFVPPIYVITRLRAGARWSSARAAAQPKLRRDSRTVGVCPRMVGSLTHPQERRYPVSHARASNASQGWAETGRAPAQTWPSVRARSRTPPSANEASHAAIGERSLRSCSRVSGCRSVRLGGAPAHDCRSGPRPVAIRLAAGFA